MFTFSQKRKKNCDAELTAKIKTTLNEMSICCFFLTPISFLFFYFVLVNKTPNHQRMHAKDMSSERLALIPTGFYATNKISQAEPECEAHTVRWHLYVVMLFT